MSSTTFQFQASGKIKLPPDEELTKLDGDNAILAYTSGKMQDGRPYYAYIAVRPSLYKKFRQLTAARQTIILRDYGEVLEAGFASSPPPEIVQKMKDQYGCDPDYEDNLVKEALKQQAVFVQKKEDDRINDIVNMLKKRPSA